MLPLINFVKDEISSLIVDRDSRMFLMPATDDLLGGNNQREYSIPDDRLNRIQLVNLKFTSTDAYQPAKSIKDYQGSETESEITSVFSNDKGEFAYTIRRRALFVLSGTIVTVTDGIKMWYNVYPADVSDLSSTTDLETDPTTTSHGFPRQFHELLARRVSIEWKNAQPTPIALSRAELNYENDLEKQLAAITREDSSLEIIAEFPDSTDLGDDGFNY